MFSITRSPSSTALKAQAVLQQRCTVPSDQGFHALGFPLLHEPVFAKILKPGLPKGLCLRTERVGLLCACLLLKINTVLRQDLATFTARELFHKKIGYPVQPDRRKDLIPLGAGS